MNNEPIWRAISPQEALLVERIQDLKKQKNAVILAHNYQIPAIQDVADYVGDSLGLARQAQQADSDLIVFCGVYFMAESAKILNPEKTVLIPNPQAGCSLVDCITAEQVREWKQKHPSATTVGYVNTSAEVKAELDYCCTSSNAVDVVNSIDPDTEILFLPDMFLGGYVQQMTGRQNMHIWQGECHVHAGIRPEDFNAATEQHPDSEFLVHPECGCSTSCMYHSAQGDIEQPVHMLSTSGMITHAKQSPHQQFVVATEVGILHQLEKQAPDKSFFPLHEQAVCEYMKMITAQHLYDALAFEQHIVEVDPEIISRAQLAIQRMVAIG